MESPNKLPKYKELITQPFFELQTPYFVWKLIWTVQLNDKVQKYKNTRAPDISTKKQNRIKTQKIRKSIKMQNKE